jgi:peptidoglycan/xylan/chitin deacetylase (PgdA/CDA1 family)
MEKPRIVSTSWDDGEQADIRVAERLRSKKVSGTFYVPISPYNGRPSLTHEQLRSLSSEGFEIGAHGFSHKLLRGLSSEELAKEINPCKPVLEDILGREVRMFCYPKGRYDSNVIRALETAGYRGARTLHMLTTSVHFKPFEMPITLQVFPHLASTYLRSVAKARFRGMQVCLAQRTRLGNWVELGKRLFDSVLESGGVWHLYGHSWEIVKMNLWDDLDEVLEYVSNREGVRYIPNGDLLQFCRQ